MVAINCKFIHLIPAKSGNFFYGGRMKMNATNENIKFVKKTFAELNESVITSLKVY